ncbi:MAG: site-2 protease family protein [Clostridiales bacterium]|nr:site-2 protease family protein [Clostridiales bacterium]
MIFGLLVFIHEGGHYIFARIFSVKINEFAIGMGPKLVSHTSKKTGIAYSLRLLPFGGFVSMAGENDESDDENAFYKKPVWQRIIITAAGALVNITVGLIAMAVIVASSDKLYSTEISAFVPKNGEYVQSSEQGLAIGDRIISIDGARVYTANDVNYEIMRRGIEPVDIVLVRNGEKIKVDNVSFRTISEEGAEFGLRDFYFAEEAKTFGNTAKHAVTRSFSSIKMIYDSVYDLISGRYSVDSVSGPVGVTQALGEAAGQDFGQFLYLAVFISINLGVMNLLPLPALDGGRIVFQVIELIRRKPVSVKVEGYIHFAGLAALMIILVLVTFKDIFSLFG